MTDRRALYIIILALAVVSSGILILIIHINTPRQNNAENKPDAFMTNVVAIKMNLEGNPKTTLYTPLLTHYSKDNVTYLTAPRFILLAPQGKGSPWDISAKHGKTLAGTDRLLLWGDVHAVRAKSATNPKTTFLTSEVMIYPHQQYATTDKDVTILQPGTIVKSKGLKAYLNTGIVNLLSHARGEYDPSQNNN